ncbi:hypothetical protein F5888DRAFT_1124578 [Russula emetica]|nr:hypothetical protein F5888DRAFT_1124578 [Russula emetica]
MSRRGRNREGDICAEKYYARYMRHLRKEARSCMVCKGRIRGGSRGEEIQQSVRDSCPPPKVDTSMWPARHCSHRQLPRSTIEGEDRRRGEERMRSCDEGMWTNGHPFIRLSGPPVVTVTVSAEILVSVGGRWTISCWNSCFEYNDVLQGIGNYFDFERLDR